MITVLRFTASWCAPCKMLAPVLQSIVEDFPTVLFETIDVDGNPDMAEHYKIRSVPTVLVEKDNEILQTFVGVQPKQIYINALNSALEG